MGQDQLLLGRADGQAVLVFDVGRVVAVVARDQGCPRWHAAVWPGHARRPSGARPPAAALTAERDGAQGEAVHVFHDGPSHHHRVVLLGQGAEVRQVVGRIVDAADESQARINDHQLAVQAAEHVQAPPQQTRLRREDVDLHARRGQWLDEGVAQVGRAIAVHRQGHVHAALGRIQQGRVQRPSHLVGREDEGLEQHLLAGLPDGLEHRGKEGLAVLQQFDVIDGLPVGLHTRISAISGAWSDRCDQGRAASTCGSWTSTPRT